MSVGIRMATEGDVAGMLVVLNEAIAESPYVFFSRPRSLEEQTAWYWSRYPQYPVVVAEHAGMVVGWGSLSPWAYHDGYDKTVEISFFVRAEHRGLGTGRRLLETLLAEGAARGFVVFLSRIVVQNAPSVLLHERMGFERVGVMKQVGHKFGQWWDVAMYQKRVEETGDG